MINNWKRFNEKSEGLPIDGLRDKIYEIKQVFVDFSDNDIAVKYSATVRQSYITGDSAEGLCDNILYSKPFADRSKPVDLSEICIEVCLYLPGKTAPSDNAILPPDSVRLLDDVVVAFQRLEEKGFGVQLNLNRNHREFKPVVFEIRFS